MSGKMLERGHDVTLILKRCVPLKSTNCRDTKLRDEVRVLPKSLLDAAPARVACHVDHWRQSLMSTARTDLCRGHRIKPLNQIGIERGSEANRLRKARRLRASETMQALFVKENGDSQARVNNEELLHGVDKLSHLTGRLPAARIADTADLTDAMAVSEVLASLINVQVASLIQ
jgi:hypothetical protein